MQTGGEEVKQFKNFADVICTWPLMLLLPSSLYREILDRCKLTLADDERVRGRKGGKKVSMLVSHASCQLHKNYRDNPKTLIGCVNLASSFTQPMLVSFQMKIMF